MKRFSLSLFLVVAAGVVATTRAQDGMLPSGVANFEIRQGRQREPLQVVRTPQRIEYRYPRREMTEIWSRETGELQHWKVFHKVRRSVHYTLGDLKTIGTEPSWERLAGLIEPGVRAALRPTHSKADRRKDLVTSEGTFQGHHTRLTWESSTAWPLELVQADAQPGVWIVRRSLQACAQEGCQMTDTSGYRELEFSDLGDMENDPFVRTFLTDHAH